MSNLEIFMANPISISSASFYPRNYSPVFLLLKNDMKNNPSLRDYITGDVKGGSTPPSHLFDENGKGIPFIKTSAVTRHYINVNDLHSINADFHSTALKRSITKPYDVIYTMTGKFMGKAAMCPHIIKEMNMSQNSVVLHTNTREEAAFLTIYLNSQVNRIQVRGIYSITKQKFMNQSKISSLKVIPYDMKYDVLMRKYLDAFDLYYDCVDRIRGIISEFNNDHGLQYTDNVLLHICGYGKYTNHLEWYKDYPVKAFNWAIYSENISLAEGKKILNNKPVFGGFDNAEGSLLYTGTKEEIQKEIYRILDESGIQGVGLGADCTIREDIDIERLQWIKDIATEYVKEKK